MTTPLLHHRDGWYFSRTDDGDVRICKRTSARTEAPVVAEIVIPADEWISIVDGLHICPSCGAGRQSAPYAEECPYCGHRWEEDVAFADPASPTTDETP